MEIFINIFTIRQGDIDYTLILRETIIYIIENEILVLQYFCGGLNCCPHKCEGSSSTTHVGNIYGASKWLDSEFFLKKKLFSITMQFILS